MKIAVIAPPWIPVPPPKYGGIENVVWNLVEGLAELGQDVILFALKDSRVSCKFFNYFDAPLYFGMDSPEDLKAFVRELSLKYAFARSALENVDIIHDHTLFKPTVRIPTVHTVYSAATEGSVKQCLELAKEEGNYLVAVSNKQKELYTMLSRDINFVNVVHHAINTKGIEWTDKKENFFLCVGKADWQKNMETVIRVAAKARVGLVLIMKMLEDEEKEFFKKEIEPALQSYPKDLLLQIHNEVTRDVLFTLFRRAKCTLMSSQWEHPFSLVMIDSMACGTPVITFRRGAASEIVVDGKTGFIVDTEEQMAEAIKKIDKIRPEDCRRHVEKHFSRRRMAEDYLGVYEHILAKRKTVRV